MTKSAQALRFEPLTLDERIQIANAVKSECIEAAERFHRRSALLRRSRFGLEVTAYQEDVTHRATNGRQTRLAQRYLGKIAPLRSEPKMLRREKSCRDFAPGTTLAYSALMDFLHLAYCENLQMQQPRPYASAGGCYSMHALLLALQPVDGAPFAADSILHVAAQEGALYLAAPTGARDAVIACLDAIPGAEPCTFANAIFVIAYVMDVEVATLRYAERGYRFALIETGLMAQQATLAAQEYGLHSCMFGGFPDAELSAALGFNPKKMLVCLTQLFGHR